MLLEVGVVLLGALRLAQVIFRCNGDNSIHLPLSENQ